jgi:SAM-dependent methyltransferase
VTLCKKSNNAVSNTSSALDYVCPVCQGAVRQYASAYECPDCERSFPVIFGIPDFRLNSDPYLSLEAERAKARALAEKAPDLTFNELVDYYYSITDDVPTELASVYKRAINNGPRHLAALAEDIERDGEGALLDAGCGSGSLLLALGARRPVVGLDIALRWLVICRKHLQEENLERQLVCADLLLPPFRDQSFAIVAGIDLLEHTQDMDRAVRSLAGLTQPGGRIWLTVSNRYTLGPHPSTRLWAIGYLPKRVAGQVSRVLRGVDSLRHVQLTSPGQVIAALKRAGFEPEIVQPKRISADVQLQPPPFERALFGIYRLLCRWALSRWLLVWIGPISEIVAKKSII